MNFIVTGVNKFDYLRYLNVTNMQKKKVEEIRDWENTFSRQRERNQVMSPILWVLKLL